MKFGVAIGEDGLIFPFSEDPEPAQNGLFRLGDLRERLDVEWFDDSLAFLNEHAPGPGQHVNVLADGDGTPVPGTSARANPWYAVFVDDEGVLWAARFMAPNLAGSLPGGEGVFFPIKDPDGGADPSSPGFVTPDMLTEQSRPARSVVALGRSAVSDGASAARDHGAGGDSGVIRDLWPANDDQDGSN